MLRSSLLRLVDKVMWEPRPEEVSRGYEGSREEHVNLELLTCKGSGFVGWRLGCLEWSEKVRAIRPRGEGSSRSCVG